MAGNPKLDEAQLVRANILLAKIRGMIEEEAAGDDNLYFAYRRKIGKELVYDERGKPEHRRRLKKRLMRLQGNMCAECGAELAAKGSILDRKEAKLGYTEANVELIHPQCDEKRQASRGYSDKPQA